MNTQVDIVINEVVDELIRLWQTQREDIKKSLITEAHKEFGVPKVITRIGINLLDAVIKSNLENNKQKLIEKAENYQSIQRLLRWLLEKIQGKKPKDTLKDLNTETLFEGLKVLEESIIQGVSWNPTLTLGESSGDIEGDVIRQLNAHNRYHTYIGREKDKQILQTFLEQDSAFSWMGITGGAGSGKTRFAYEVGHIAQKNCWRVGFLEKKSLKNLEQLQNWQPIVPTLIFIDYAKDHADEVQELLSALSAQQWNDGVLVRLVLIDRYGFEITAGVQKKEEIGGKRFTQFENEIQSDNLILSPLSDSEIKALIRVFPNIDVEQIVTYIKEKNYHIRPLYILLSCLQLDGNKQKSIEDILGRLIERQGKKPWDTHNDENAVETAQAIQIATLFGEFTFQDFTAINVEISNHSKKQEITTAATKITRYEDDILRPLEPDLLGEYFVLALMGFLSKQNLPLHSTLFEKDLTYYVACIKRCYDDFPEKLEELSKSLIDPLPNDLKQNISEYIKPNARKLFEDHLSAILTNDIKTAREFFDKLTALANTNPNNSEIQLRLTKGAVNWLSGLNKNPADFEEARTVFTQLQTLAETNPNNSEIQLALANGAVNWLSGLSENPADFEEARTVFTQLQTLAETNPDNSEIQLRLAKGAFNWLSGLNKNPANFEEARTVFTQLQTLAKTNPDNSEIQLELAKGAFNWLSGLNKNPANFEEARTVFTQLQTLAETNTNNSEIQLALANGAVNWLSGLSENPADFEEARTVFTQLQTLAETNPNNSEIQLALANGVFNWLSGLSENPADFEEARTVFTQLQTLAETNPDNSEIQLRLAKGAFNWLSGLNKNPANFEEARTVFTQLQTLAKTNPDNSEIQLELAKGAFNWLSGLNKNPANFEEARTVFTQLQTLAETNTNNSEIQLALANGAVNWLSGLSENPADFEEARTVFTQLQTLAETNPNNSEIQLALANGAFNWLSGLSENPADFEEARTVFTQLQTLAETNPNNSEIQLALANGVFNWLSGLSENPADFEEARTVFTQLQTLAKANPNNSEIQLELANGAFNWLSGLNKNSNTIPNNEIKQVEKVLLGALSDLVQQVESFKPEFAQELWQVLTAFKQIQALKEVAQDLQQAIQTHFSS